jgi:isoleucyl-tRNA synthetase
LKILFLFIDLRIGIFSALCSKWTTTPWTLPANEAVALHPELDYVLVDTGNEYLLLAQALAENALSRYDIQGATIGINCPANNSVSSKNTPRLSTGHSTGKSYCKPIA